MAIKYLLFAGSDCYPRGGVGDFVGSFDSVEDAKKAVPNDDWAHVAYFTENGDLKVMETFRRWQCMSVIEITRPDGEVCHKHHFGPLWMPGKEQCP